MSKFKAQLSQYAFLVASRVYRFFDNIRTNAIIKYGRLMNKSDKWIAAKVLGNQTKADADAMLTLVNIVTISKGLCELTGVNSENDVLKHLMRCIQQNKPVSPEAYKAINDLYGPDVKVKALVELWAIYNMPTGTLFGHLDALPNDIDFEFWNKFLRMPLLECSVFAITQEEFDAKMKVRE